MLDVKETLPSGELVGKQLVANVQLSPAVVLLSKKGS